MAAAFILVEAWDGAILWCGAITKVDKNLVDVAPAPSFRWIVALDERMASGVKMLSGVAVG